MLAISNNDYLENDAIADEIIENNDLNIAILKDYYKSGGLYGTTKIIDNEVYYDIMSDQTHVLSVGKLPFDAAEEEHEKKRILIEAIIGKAMK